MHKGSRTQTLSLSRSLFLAVAVLYTETPRYTRTSGSTHDEGLPVLSPAPYDSLEANHKIVIEVSYAVTLERGMTNSRTPRATSGRALPVLTLANVAR